MRKMFSLDEIASSVNGKIVNRSPRSESPVYVSGVTSDTRKVSEGELFIAIKGEKFDGHDFLGEAMAKGASVLLVSDEDKIPEGAVAVVAEDTVKAMGLLARHYRFKINAKVIAVTGSVGKTSTREMIACSVSAIGNVWSTKLNLNNEIGLPQTILSAPENTDIMVLEMGMRLRGEISYLTNIACPDIAVITNVGFSHIERLGSREEILHAKMEITEGLTENGILIVNCDDELLFDYARKVLPIGKFLGACSTRQDFDTDLLPVTNCPVFARAVNITNTGDGMCFDYNAYLGDDCAVYKDVRLGVTGVHHVKNALFAIMCAGMLLKDMPEASIKALSGFSEMAGRGKVITTDRYLIIDDAYNAAPESMVAAFENLDISGKGRRKVCILGGMLELGSYSPELHEYVGRECGKHGFDKIIVTGQDKDSFIRGLLSSDPEADYSTFEDTASISEELFNVIEDGDALLFKASNAFGFKDLVKLVSER